MILPLVGCAESSWILRPFTHRTPAESVPGDDPYLAGHDNASNTPPAGKTAPTLNAKADDSLVTLGKPEAIVPSRDTPLVRSTIHPTGNDPSARDSSSNLLIAIGPPASTAAPALATNTPRPRPRAESVGAGRPAQPKLDSQGVVNLSKAQLAKLTNYQVKINRQERVGDTLQTPEDVLLSIRRDPKAVRLEWLAGSHKGREVLYSASDASGMMHVHSGDTIVPVPDLQLSPDSALMMRNSRHPITEAGFDTILQHIEDSLASKDPASRNTYEGIETPQILGRPCYKLARVTPKAERWLVYIDKGTLFPTIVEARDSKGELLERYIFQDVKTNLSELAANDAFDPGLRWRSGVASGFLSRIARATSGDAKTTATPTQR